MKKTDEPDSCGRNTLIEQYHEALKEAARYKDRGRATAQAAQEAEEARIFLELKKKMGDVEWKKWWEDGGHEDFAEDYALGKVRFPSAEKDEPKKKLRPNQLAKVDARSWAQTHWNQPDPTTKRQMATEIHDNVKSCEAYTIITIERWIVDLDPKRVEKQRKHGQQSRKMT